MERLTLVETGEILIKDGFYKKDTGNYTSICYGCTDISRCVNRCGFYKAFKKLAEYEDTGLRPNEITSLKEHLDISRSEVQGLSGRLVKLQEKGVK